MRLSHATLHCPRLDWQRNSAVRVLTLAGVWPQQGLGGLCKAARSCKGLYRVSRRFSGDNQKVAAADHFLKTVVDTMNEIDVVLEAHLQFIFEFIFIFED